MAYTLSPNATELPFGDSTVPNAEDMVTRTGLAGLIRSVPLPKMTLTSAWIVPLDGTAFERSTTPLLKMRLYSRLRSGE